jgi:hypothetical protein
VDPSASACQTSDGLDFSFASVMVARNLYPAAVELKRNPEDGRTGGPPGTIPVWSG